MSSSKEAKVIGMDRVPSDRQASYFDLYLVFSLIFFKVPYLFWLYNPDLLIHIFGVPTHVPDPRKSYFSRLIFSILILVQGRCGKRAKPPCRERDMIRMKENKYFQKRQINRQSERMNKNSSELPGLGCTGGNTAAQTTSPPWTAPAQSIISPPSTGFKRFYTTRVPSQFSVITHVPIYRFMGKITSFSLFHICLHITGTSYLSFREKSRGGDMR